MTAPATNTPAAVEFLKQMIPGGPWCVTAIDPTKKAPVQTRVFSKGKEFQLNQFIDSHNGSRNIYFTHAPKIDESRKRGLDQTRCVNFLHVDIDPRASENLDLAKEQGRILELLTDKRPAGIPAPSVIVFSGNGYQAFWRLTESEQIDGDVDKANALGLYNKALAQELDGDSCQDVCRILRLPGTTNVPNAKKLKKKRVPVLAKLIAFNDTSYPLGDFKKADPVVATAGAAPKGTPAPLGEIVSLDMEALKDKGLNDFTRVVIAQGMDPENPERWKDDRSDGVYYVVCEMVRQDFKDEEIIGIIKDPGWGISEHVLEQKDVARYVLRQCARARIAVAKEPKSGFDTDKNDKPYKTQDNIRVALTKLNITLSHNTFADFLVIDGLPGYSEELQDAAINHLWLAIDQQFGFRPSKELFWAVLQNEARGDPFNPVCDYLDGLSWDGTPRIDSWLSEYGGAESSDYTHAIARLMLVAAVRRVRQPGCKFDEMVIFVNPTQGTNKSSAIAALVPDSKWFSDDLPLGVDSKIVIERTSGVWILEAPELRGMGRGGVAKIKSFLSRGVDRARLAYCKLPTVKERAFIVVGSTNDAKFLNDLTGHRRFWPVDVKRFDVKGLRAVRDQLWAEAAHLESNGSSIRLDSSLWAAAGAAQAAHEIDNPFFESLQAVLRDSTGKIRSVDCWSIAGTPAQRSQTDNINLHNAMKALGFERKMLRFGRGSPMSAYYRGEQPYDTIEVVRGQGGRWRLASDEELDDEIPF